MTTDTRLEVSVRAFGEVAASSGDSLGGPRSGSQRAQLRRLVPEEVLERWQGADRSAQHPELVAVVGADGEWAGVALVTARPGASYLKIVDAVGGLIGDAVGGTVGGLPQVVAAVLDLARSRGLVQVKWEGWTVSAADAVSLGFAPLEPPRASPTPPTSGAPSPPAVEAPAAPADLRSGYVRWLADASVQVAEPPYYRQTENFTCGAVVALIAQVHAGEAPRDSFDRSAELALWRSATNFPACEPVGLGVAVHRSWPGSSVAVALDVDRPVVLDSYPEPDRGWRAELQRASRADALELGVPLTAERLTMAGIRTAIESGEQVLLLISLAAMQGFEVPHWVVCHAAVPGAIVLEDPWSSVTRGETWVDAHLLPVPDEALDAMSSMEHDGYRGAVVLGRAR